MSELANSTPTDLLHDFELPLADFSDAEYETKNSCLSFPHCKPHEIAGVTTDVVSPVSKKLDGDTVNSFINSLLSEIMQVNSNSNYKSSDQYLISIQKDKYIFITGGTGFFGRFLVAKLLTSPNSANVMCLVRGCSVIDGERRLLHSLLQTKLLNECEISYFYKVGKLNVVIGDIEKPFLGLGCLKNLRLLANNLQCIIHGAACVKFYDSNNGFSLLKNCNIVGTKNILEVSCCLFPQIPIVYISTLSCSYLNVQSFDSDKFEDIDGYTLTKYLSELLFNKVCDLFHSLVLRSMKILRLPLLTWSSLGCHNDDDWLQRLIDSCSMLRLLPATNEVRVWKNRIPYLSVDDCADLICNITDKSCSKISLEIFDFSDRCKNIHLYVDRLLELRLPNSCLSVEEVFDFLENFYFDPERQKISLFQRVSEFSFLKGVMQNDFLPFSPLADMLLSDLGSTKIILANEEDIRFNAKLQISLFDTLFKSKAEIWKTNLRFFLLSPTFTCTVTDKHD
jgi:thioester reductase-like protein